MKTLAGWAAIFGVATLMAGIWGMNFDIMPELHVWWAYPTLMVFMAALGIGMFLTFRKRGWV